MHSLHTYLFWFIICSILPKGTNKLKWRRLDEGYDVGDLKFTNGNRKREAHSRNIHIAFGTLCMSIQEDGRRYMLWIFLVMQGRQIKNGGRREIWQLNFHQQRFGLGDTNFEIVQGLHQNVVVCLYVSSRKITLCSYDLAKDHFATSDQAFPEIHSCHTNGSIVCRQQMRHPCPLYFLKFVPTDINIPTHSHQCYRHLIPHA